MLKNYFIFFLHSYSTLLQKIYIKVYSMKTIYVHIQRSFIFLVFFCTYTPTYAVENISNNKSTILALGMEMSHMRNMLEAYILIGAKINYKNPTQKLKNGIAHYETLLGNIQKNYSDEHIQQSVKKSLRAWEHVKKAMEIALQNATPIEMKKGAIFIHGNIRTVIKELSFMKKYFLDKSDIPNKKALNASIEIAASARRLSAHYMMDLWHLDDPTIQKHWDKGLKIYEDSLNILKHSSFVKNHKFNALLRKSIKLHHYFTKMGKKAKIYSILIDKKADMSFKQAKEMTTIILQSKP